ncbi:hypothetical protein EYZ11_012851 [Aspergillus tanneri]|uniref:Transcription factor domain-containing protein n=1 Tax=Aspergillus tanneri TaxID=1220188 RepID=A0A4S3IZ71_9EURO|nr:hypothetical protein EYZ11_012851 [Aspergillus tanneri]
MTDLLRKAQLPELSYYQALGRSTEAPPKKRGRKESTVSTEDTGAVVENDRKVNSVDIGAITTPGGRGIDTRPFRQQSQFALDREENGTSSLVTAPMGSLYEVTQLSDIQARTPERQYAPDRALVTDFVSRGIVDLQEAEELFFNFDQVLNRYLWDGIALVHKDLTSVRNSSSMLSAAILAVTALHMPNKERTFDTCYTEFAKLASESMLDRHHTLDDLRALCIGAFWLADVSWKLSGYAVRIATERNLHQSYRKATQGSPEHIEQARLWYLLYVDLFIILTRIYHAFGPDVDLEVPESEFSTIEKFDADLGEWQSTWFPRLAGSRYVGAYPYKAVYLHYHFSRLQLNSVALRTYHSSTSTRFMSDGRKKYANMAIQSAIGTLLVVLDEPDIQTALVGVPLYLHSMITFAAVFLLKIAAKGCSSNIPGNQQNSIASAGLLIDVAYVRALVGRVIELMISCSKRASERHLSHHIARGLRKMLTGLEEWEKRRSCSQQSTGQHCRDHSSMFKSIIIPGAQPLGERDTILTHPPPLLGVAPLSAERGNGFDPEAARAKAQTGLSEGSLDPMMADPWGFDEEYFPTGVFDFLQSQMPA